MLVVRNYKPADLDAVIDAFQAAILQTARADYTQAQVDAWAQVDREAWHLRRLSRPTWVAEIQGSVAGFTDLEADGHLDMMFVHPRYKARGVATSLVQVAEQ
ncbi:GNAT family N-acetyltransferase, partial [Paracoccus sp. (in: a-proteobacteria)]|uniref:GNAT family N-acetyltransferase n=1 Tax=Paracoccus sp. TaxID=267 RepID=UPI00396CCB8B